ncbi:membrane protein [Advenella kashmirensis W13003]|uniref:Membrane protein n=1 Tax=Advenella kashmirensis W13003 TaxID=1424334 RepID=V8QVH9_9BURK|nr:OmpW family outer membrane protein [Advenella kashmirensis]ETF03358.1 membrane protein [Advenella kashmirensis W13003]
MIAVRHIAVACTVAVGSLLATPAVAHEAGDWIVKAGLTSVMPTSDNGTVGKAIAPRGIGLDIDSSTRPSFSLTYMATRHLGIELLAAAPFQHDIRGDAPDLGGDIGRIGKTRHLPPTLSLQWHFLPDAAVQPYVGVGVNYTTFFHTKPTGALRELGVEKLTLSDSWGLAAQVGADVRLSENWFMNASVRYIDIKTKVRIDGTKIGTAKVNPWVATIGVGYRF